MSSLTLSPVELSLKLFLLLSLIDSVYTRVSNNLVNNKNQIENCFVVSNIDTLTYLAPARIMRAFGKVMKITLFSTMKPLTQNLAFSENG